MFLCCSSYYLYTSILYVRDCVVCTLGFVEIFVAHYSENNTALRKPNLRDLLPTDFELNEVGKVMQHHFG